MNYICSINSIFKFLKNFFIDSTLYDLEDLTSNGINF